MNPQIGGPPVTRGPRPPLIRPGVKSFNTQLSNYSVEWSPFVDNLLAVAASQHYGIIGNGRQIILEVTPEGVRSLCGFDTQDGLYDCTWSEQNENHILSASGDGSIKLWDIKLPPRQNPLRAYEEHTHEVYSVDWNLISKDLFVSGSWDDTVKLWTPERKTSLVTWKEHKYCVYCTLWSPHSPNTFASVSGDYALKIWDIKEGRKSIKSIQAHKYEILSCDWNRYKDYEIVTSSVDKTLRIWDLRKFGQPVLTLNGHNYAVRRVKASPHDENTFASVSYDFCTCLWDLADEEDPLVERLEMHTEFVIGVDWNIFIEGRLATCSWDETVLIFDRPRANKKRNPF